MANTTLCCICGTNAVTRPKYFDGDHQQCPRCGEFRITRSVARDWHVSAHNSAADVARLSGWVRDQTDIGDVPAIHSDNLPSILALPRPTMSQRIDRLLLFIARHQSRLGALVPLCDPRAPGPNTTPVNGHAAISSTHSTDWEEVSYLLNYARQEKYIFEMPNESVRLEPAGVLRIEEIERVPKGIRQGFVAMWFSPDVQAAYDDGFNPAIRAAGYECRRIDGKEHINKIDDEIIAEIRKSRFIVADFTGHRGGVYFEAGFALGLGLPVFWTCRRDHLPQTHFDTRQYNCIDWATPTDLRARLQKRIEAVIGQGPVVS
jgi:hypothetical protein